jgi:hypothetical protein
MQKCKEWSENVKALAKAFERFMKFPTHTSRRAKRAPDNAKALGKGLLEIHEVSEKKRAEG